MWILLPQFFGKLHFQQIKGVSVYFFLLSPCFTEIPVFNANGVDPKQARRFAATDLGLHILLMSLLWDATHK